MSHRLAFPPAALLACLLPAALLAQDGLDLAGQEVMIRQMQQAIETDPSTVDSLAERMARSSLAEEFSTAELPERRLEDIRKWVASKPDEAARIAVGLARDDAEGSTAYETALKTTLSETRSRYDKNPNIGKTVYGRLKRSSRDSVLLKNNEEMKDEEKREIIKTMFEGAGSMSNKIVTFGPGSAAPQTPGAVLAGEGFYDRLNTGNLTGYSPQLLSIQNALNARRVPGAPRLAETGRLDYETLGHPSYQMRFDLNNLELRLRYARSYFLARILGREKSYKPDELISEEVARKLEAEAKGTTIDNPRLAKRLKILERIKGLLADFESTAAASRDPARITRALLSTLGAKQKEAARWITIASLEEELQMIESEEGFFTGELARAIDACPVADDAKAAYKRRGEDFKKKLSSLKANDEAAIKALESATWASAVAKVEALLADNVALRKNLSRNIRDFVDTPFRLAASHVPRPRWRQIMDDLIRRFLPSSGYAIRLQRTETELNMFKDVFIKIATGDLDAAHAILRSGG